MPISLFPAVPYSGQIEILYKTIEALLAEQDLFRLSYTTSMIQNFQEENYDEIFSKDSMIKTSKHAFYEKSSIGMIHLNYSANNIFTKENYSVIEFIRDKLESTDLNWIFVITLDITLVFTFSHNQFLSWSPLLKGHSIMFMCLSLINQGVLDLINDEYRTRSYKNSLLTLNQIYTSILENQISENTYKSHSQYLQDLLKFNSFETSHNYFKLHLESLLSSSYDTFSKEALNDVLKLLERQPETEIFDKINLIALLDISPMSLLEITPFIKNEKLRGQFYTPLELAIPLIINSFQNKISMDNNKYLRILDPACGTGILLVVAIEYVVNQLIKREQHEGYLKLRQSVFYSNITGMDIDERLIHYCKSFFSLFLNSPSAMSDSEIPILHKNFLEDFVDNCTIDPLLVPKYDLIISNPPYIPFHSRFMKNVLSDKFRKKIQEFIPKFMGKRDNLYIIFFGLALEHLAKPKHGIVSFIIDSSFLDLPSYKLIRQHLLSEFTVLYILSQYKYDRAVVDLSIITLRNSKNNNDFLLWQESINQEPIQQQISDILDQPNFSYSIQLNPAVRGIIRSIQDRSVLLDDVCRISCGLEYGSLLKTHFLSPVKKLDYFRVIDGANGLPQSFVLFWVPNCKNSYVRVSKDFEDLLKINNLNLSPKANKRVLLISGSKDRFTTPKIIIRQTASQFVATYDEEGYFGLRNLHIIHSFNNGYSPLLILGILSSKLGNYLGIALNIIRGSGNFTNRYPQIRIGDLKRFPIINISTVTQDQLKTIEKLKILVNECLKDGKELTDTYKDIWNNLLKITPKLHISSQKRFFQILDSPKRLNFFPSDVLNKITPWVKKLQMQKRLLEQKQEQINEYVIKIYGLSKEDYSELDLTDD